ncbi:MFS transporter [Sulfurisphaera ohwakuensis]|uniref:MFS family permease n=1 Tax=Sulfurisphaera ohwakuensis TaxID=69656 RepID=A0A650CEX1_SULOH|nr:MFS transporter [Sulfurisphaera ohwakuensis]MBB5254417.1 MFS family permease [Sulfurisphaera ohwakuensis]QGR16344.1 MFS transporter [Sulfurisphaera ohwakuensis]
MRLSWTSVLVSGMGVFTDGYNLYSLSLTIYLISNYISLNSVTEGILVAGSYFGAGIAAILFGILSDFKGRKRMYGIDVTLMSIGAIAQAISQNYVELFVSRLLLGMGIGADYVLSPIIVAENAEAKNRGKLMVITFAVLWGLGAVFAAFVDQISSIFLPSSLVWRVVLGVGAIPAISVIMARRKLTETLQFLTKVKPDENELQKIKTNYGLLLGINVDKEKFINRLKASLPFIIVASVLWLLYDIYSSTFAIYGPIVIASNLGLTPITFTYVAQFFAGIPGQLLCIYLIDKVGRKILITIGYAGVALWLVMYSLLLLDPYLFGFKPMKELVGEAALLGFSFYMLNYFFSAIGPASIIGSAMVTPELTYTKVRGTGQAISVAVDRFASATVISLFPSLVNIVGLGAMVGVYAGIAFLSSLITMLFVPETKGKELDEVVKSSLKYSK